MPLIQTSTANSGEAIALRDGHCALGWAEVDLLTARATAAICRDNSSGRRVGVFARNAAETTLAYVATLRAAASPVPVNFHLTATECSYILGDADVGILLTGPENAGVALEADRQAGIALVVDWRCTPMSQTVQ